MAAKITTDTNLIIAI